MHLSSSSSFGPGTPISLMAQLTKPTSSMSLGQSGPARRSAPRPDRFRFSEYTAPKVRGMSSRIVTLRAHDAVRLGVAGALVVRRGQCRHMYPAIVSMIDSRCCSSSGCGRSSAMRNPSSCLPRLIRCWNMFASGSRSVASTAGRKNGSNRRSMSMGNYCVVQSLQEHQAATFLSQRQHRHAQGSEALSTAPREEKTAGSANTVARSSGLCWSQWMIETVHTLGRTLADEFAAVHGQECPADEDSYRQLAAAQDQSALCLSGGGIRSAAFSLGVVQALADAGLLTRFDYLSTVSGGGFTGSWLSALIAQQGGAEAAEAVLRRGGAAPAVRALREYTNYLTPRRGLLSADTWAGIVLYLRNVLINWFAFGPVFLLAVLAAIFYRTLLWTVGGNTWTTIAAAVVAASGLVVATWRASLDLPSHRPLTGARRHRSSISCRLPRSSDRSSCPR